MPGYPAEPPGAFASMSGGISFTYFVHGTTTDNERGIATGWLPGELSELGVRQSAELKKKISGKRFDIAFCSDLKRAVDSAKLMFDSVIPIIQDARLRECNYGDLNGEAAEKVDAKAFQCIDKPFPNGESYLQVEARLRAFLEEMLEKQPGRNIAIVAHKAPQLALEVICNGKSWRQAMEEDWRRKDPPDWKPGWTYGFGGFQ